MFEMVGGAIIAIVITITVEMLRRPKLRLQIAAPEEADYPHGRPAIRGRSLTVKLINEPLPLLFRWMSRNPALQCQGTISFHYLDGQRFFADAMPMRFAHSPQPTPMQIVLGDMSGILVDPARFSINSRIDVYPGESTPIDIAVKFDSEEECYGWSNLSYLSDPLWRHPDWKLPQGRYLIEVTVNSSGQKCAAIFRLFNQGAPKNLRLEPALSNDKINNPALPKIDVN